MRRRSTLPAIVNVAVFILLEIASLYLLRHNTELQGAWITRMSNGFKSVVWGGSESVSDFFALKGTNYRLANDNYLLQQEVLRLQDYIRNARIDTMKVRSSAGFTMIPAEVVKMSRNKQHNYIILNRGYEDGVKEKSGIITREGVIGIVDAVSARHAYALSFQNNDLSISARLGESGDSGLLVWDGKGSRGAILKELPLQSKYSPGDTVFTSGHSLIFPPDIPLGTAGNAKIVNGATKEISVTLFQEFKAIRYAIIVHNNSLEEVEEFLK